jgi:hypothetical protein
MVNKKGEYRNYPVNWTEFKEEIAKFLQKTCPGYRKKLYITPGLYRNEIEENPEEYPLLNSVTVSIRTRHISYFLREQGRIRGRGNNKRQMWVLPKALKVKGLG